jgi:hypothetical protein
MTTPAPPHSRTTADELAKRSKLLEHALLGFLEVHRHRVAAFDLDEELGPIYELALVVADNPRHSPKRGSPKRPRPPRRSAPSTAHLGSARSPSGGWSAPGGAPPPLSRYRAPALRVPPPVDTGGVREVRRWSSLSPADRARWRHVARPARREGDETTRSASASILEAPQLLSRRSITTPAATVSTGWGGKQQSRPSWRHRSRRSRLGRLVI